MTSLRLKSPRTVSTEALVVAAALWLTLTANGPFWHGVLQGRDFSLAASWGFAAATGVILIALHSVLIGLLAHRRTVRPLLALLFICAASASYYTEHYGTVLDPSMMRNVLVTDTREAGELLGLGFLGHVLLWGGLPALALLGVQVQSRPWGRALLRRALALVLATLLGLAALMLVFQDFGSLMRNQKNLRYAITPANLIWSLSALAIQHTAQAQTPRLPPDPATRRIATAPRRPTVLIVVVGETARAANWGLNGYTRATTPELAQRAPISFTNTQACGTATEISLPCMFSPYGRADYDESLIRRTDSVLHVLDRAGVAVLWRDNQSGCKGVCAGLPLEDLSRAALPEVCAEDRCLDEVLLHGLNEQLNQTHHDAVIVLHMLGNHGPAYHRRYPQAFERWSPACRSDELRHCSREAIVNAYDNALLYTDHVLAQAIDLLQSHARRLNAALLYVSDHGESLGERGLYLHGMPYAMAPREQLEIPMFWWLPSTTAAPLGIDRDCLQARAHQAASHDTLYHSIVGLMDVNTPRYKADRDVFAGCRG